MKYVLINPFPWSRANGVTSYVRNMLSFLRDAGVDTVCISNEDELSRADYQRFVRETIVSQFRPGEIVVEAPELKATTRLLPREFPVHIRLHCPNAIVEHHNEVPVQWEEFAEEMEVVRAARVVSSPSCALLRALQEHLETGSAHVYKNPLPDDLASAAAFGSKERDIVFLSRFSRLKGMDFLDSILRTLPAGLSVALAGRGSDSFTTPPEACCRVTVHGEIVGQDRFRLLGESRVTLVLSRFENCSMTILESLAMGTVVAGWRVGGNEEIAGTKLIRLAPLGDIESLAAAILELLEAPYPDGGEFRAATDRLRQDFRDGWWRVWNTFQATTPAL